MILASNRAMRVAWCTIRNFLQDDCTLLSAAIAFYTLLSLAPSLYLIGVGLSAVFEGIDTSQQIVELIARFLPPAAVPTVESVQDTLQIRGDLVIVAVPGLLWTATHAVSSFEYALNIAFARNSGLRRIWRSRAKGFAVLIASGLFLAAFFLTNMLLPLLGQFRTILGLPPMPDPLAYLGSSLVSPALTFIVFYLFYRLLPSGRVQRGPAAAGAVMATVGWEGARQLFGLLLQSSPTFGLLTGTLAGVLAFLFWIYTGLAIVLLGAQFAAVLNGDRRTDAPR
jgi:membrane protein